MALSFEESKKLLEEQAAAATPMMMAATPMAMSMTPEDIGVMTLAEGTEPEMIAAYSVWNKSEKYEWYDEYSDDRVSTVDQNKNITVDASQVNISQEENSQFIPFEMPRYYDGFDLMSATIWFYYLSSDGFVGASKAINVSYDTATIKFGWLVDANATRTAGNLKFEIRAIGSNSKGNAYVWKTKTFDKMNVLQSLIHDKVVEVNESWVKELVEDVAKNIAREIGQIQVADQVAAAESAANRAEVAADNAEQTVNNALVGYATEEFVNTAVAGVDVSDQLKNYALKEEVPTKVSVLENDAGYLTASNIEGLATETYVQEEIAKIDVTEQLNDYALKTYVDDAVAAVDVSSQLVDYAKSKDVYTKSEIDTKTGTMSSDISSNTTNITSLSTTVGVLQEAVNSIDKSPRLTYDIAYNDVNNPDVGEYGFVLYEITNEGVDGESKEVKAKVVISGGGGGGNVSTTLNVERITASPLTLSLSDKAIIEYNVSSVDADGETVDCSYTWSKGGTIIASGACTQGKNTFDATEFISTGTHKLTLKVTDEGGSVSVKTWTIQIVDVRIETSFNDTVKYTANAPVNFTYTPYGAIEKTIHFKLDGVELEPVKTTVSGILQSYTLPAKSHGAHLLEVWVTAIVNNVEVEPDHIYKDIIWFDEASDVPVIGCIYRYDYYGKVAARQYNATDITYVVYDPNEVNATVTKYVDGKSIGEQTLDKSVDIWSYKTADVGEKDLKIECGSIYVDIKLDVAELGITIEPVTANLAFDFNPTGKSNSDENRVWTDANTGVTMSVSDNFDWVNGGYQRDENGDQYFCVKAGDTATINYNLFGDTYDPKANGKEFKFVFKTTNVKKRSSTFLSCIEDTVAEDGTKTSVGIDMTVENTNIYARNKSIFVPYSEEDIIEFEFNINKDTDIPLLMTYEDGVANRPLIYASDSSFMQLEPKPIVVGSQDCDVHIYRMKAYDTSLTDKEILSNFIADARNADEMIARYERNDIYDENGALTPEVLAEKCPDLRIIMIDAPWFTNDKDDKVAGTTVRQIYKGGDPVYDNWTCVNALHSGQGTSSNKYGYAGRNLRLIMNEDDSLFTFNGTDELGNPITGKTVTLGKDSVPNAFWNIKVNIASSENQNNAQMARRYNQFNPFVRAAKAKDSKVKDTMEFYNCVVFIRENESDLSKHREFNDTLWHFYAIGNVGDDKKTDKSRVNDSKDPKECVVEIMDYDVPLAEFPTGIGGDYIAPSQWKAGNTAYDNLYSAYTYDEEGKFKGFGAESYEFRYEMKGITTEQRQANIDAWRDFYRFVVTSTDEEFVANFENYFVLDSALYYYLFTERYLMVDNRAKNSFWHRGRVYITQAQYNEMGEDKAKGYIVDDTKAIINDGYRWDLTFGYDFDTSLGISNTGQLVLTYGQEDVDKYATNGEYIYRAAESNFFCRIRDLFADQLKGMFQSRESLRAWSSNDLIKQWDDAQSQFPEELWRIDVERKYIRTYRGTSIDNSIAGKQDPTFLEPMLNGRKKYQRRQIERNNELYFATKYVSTFAKDDFIRMRFTKPEGVAIAPDYTLYLTPYTDMYITAEFGNTAPIVFRAKAGIEYPVARKTESDTADIVLIYGASFIQAIGDLSRCYLREGNFSKATRLQSLTIGSNTPGYKNESLTQLALENNKLLEYLDIRQTTELKTVIDLSQCNNIIEFHAEGSGVTGVIFANGGKLEKAYLPAVASLTMKNLQYIDDFEVSSYGNLQQLVIENVPAINTYNIVNVSPLLNTIRLVGINWDATYNIQNTSILDRLMKMRGIDDSGYTIPKSVLTGYFYAAVVKEKELADYNAQWKFLAINQGTLKKQFSATFINYNGDILEVQYVDEGTPAINPIERVENPMQPPIQPSSPSTDYTFIGWDKTFVPLFTNEVYKATYSETTRKYTVKYVNKNNDVLQTTVAEYGTTVIYDGPIPTYTLEEPGFAYYLFSGWDKFGYVDGDKTINAVYDDCRYVGGYFDGKDISELDPVEIYAMLKVDEAGYINVANYVESKDKVTITLGNDISYPDIKQQVLIDNETKFNGANYVDKFDNEQVLLLDQDKDFVIAIDYSFSNETPEDSVIAQCYVSNGQSGFRLIKQSGEHRLYWGGNYTTISSGNNREILVLRHIKGENGIHVYSSNMKGNEATYIELDGIHSMVHNGSLRFGCGGRTTNLYEYYAQGSIYWSKVWYADLGHETCLDLVVWPHDKMSFSMCGFDRYLRSDNPDLTSTMSFLADGVLPNQMKINSISSTTGGWDAMSLNAYLNNRIYNAFPHQWKQLLKQVKISSTEGNKSFSTSDSNCYIAIPSLIELNGSLDNIQNIHVYNNEGYVIDYFVPNTGENVQTLRQCYDKNGNTVSYWTRSPNVNYSNYQFLVNTNGSLYGYAYANESHYVRIIFSI